MSARVAARGAALAERDAMVARVIVDLLGRTPHDDLAGAHDDLRELPPGVYDAVLAEAHTRADFERAECDALDASWGCA